ncbi:MAG TPA: hypothetical protein PKY82_34615, partial [Pyrinomonadaceae bacterium]|nr:hypothetical protein [Pyrinomonadaceae bacterium]
MDLLLTIFLFTIVSFLIWYSGVLTTLIELVMTIIGKSLSWAFDPRLPTGKLTESLNYRGFWNHEEVIETKTHIYTALELIPIPSDGLDVIEWNSLFSQLNFLLTNLPVGTIVDFECEVSNDDLGAKEVLERITSQQKNNDLVLINQARLFQLQHLQRQGILKNTRLFCFIGRPIRSKKMNFSFKNLLSPDQFLENEYSGF